MLSNNLYPGGGSSVQPCQLSALLQVRRLQRPAARGAALRAAPAAAAGGLSRFQDKSFI